jgi:ATP-dependent helicase/nuclease subunit B
MELDQDHWLDAAQFGRLLHEVFRQVMSELAAAGKRPEFERDHGRLAAILQTAVQRWRHEVPPPNDNAFRTQCWRLVRTSRIFLQAEEEFCRTSQPRYFEVAIGIENTADGSPLDDPEPATLLLPNGKSIRVKGQIDRIDEVGQQRFAVWDYKVGSGYGYTQVDPFRNGTGRLSSIALGISFPAQTPSDGVFHGMEMN